MALKKTEVCNKYATKCLLFVLLLVYFGLTNANINKIKGLPEQNIPLVKISTLSGLFANLTLHYNADKIPVSEQTPNDYSPTGWTGLGWELNTPYISVEHNNSVNTSDDEWFYHDYNGSSNEIIRYYENNIEKFVLKQNPFVKVKVNYSETVVGLIPIIIGWELVDIDGTTQYFGSLNGTPTDANRKVFCWGNDINTGYPSSETQTVNPPRDFYYKWDLKRVEDVNKSWMEYTYQQDTKTAHGFTYTRQSYPLCITSDNGEKVTFGLGNKDENEGNLYDCGTEFDLSESKYLLTITKKNKKEIILNKIQCNYSGDFGEVNHFNWANKGLAKRLLTSIQSNTDLNLNYNFLYNTSAGIDKCFLKKVMQPKLNTSLIYHYTMQQLMSQLTNSFQLPYPVAEYENVKMTTKGDHIFCIDRNEQTKNLKFSIFDRVNTKWQKSFIQNVTEQDLGDLQIFPGIDYFIIHDKEIKEGILKWYVYEWIDNKWQKTVTHEEDVGDFTPEDGDFYYFILEKEFYVEMFHTSVSYDGKPSEDLIQIYQKNELGVGDRDPLPFNWFGGGNDVRTAENYVILEHYKTDNGKVERYLVVARFDGEKWSKTEIEGQKHDEGTLWWSLQPFEPKNLGSYDIQLFKDYFVIKRQLTDGSTEIFIRRWNQNKQKWVAEYFTGTDLVVDNTYKNFKWPRPLKLYASNNYATIVEPDNWMMIYRYQDKGDQNYAWQRTYIAATAPCSDPRKNDANHKFGSNLQSTFDYAKVFNKQIDNIYCSDRYFVALNKQNGTMWNYKWNGNDISGNWESMMNSTDGLKDADCQGLTIRKPIIDVFPNNDNIGVINKRSDPGGVVNSYYFFDYISNTYSDRSYRFNNTSDKISDLNCYTATLSKNNDVISIEIIEPYFKNWYAPLFSTVSGVSINNGLGHSLENYYIYNTDFCDFSTRTGINAFSNVVEIDGFGSITGKTTYNFNTDSTRGMYGQLLSVVEHCASETEPVPDKKIKISGWLLELDGSMPKTGYVRVSIPSTNTFSDLKQIDLISGRFDGIELDNPDGRQFTLEYVPVMSSSQSQTVFVVDPTSKILNKVPELSENIQFTGDGYKWENIQVPFGADFSNDHLLKCGWNGTRDNTTGVSSTFNIWSIYRKQLGAYNTSCIPRLIQKCATTNGVTTSQINPFDKFDPDNNLPTVSYLPGNNGTVKVQQTIFAHDLYPQLGKEIGQQNMLSQTAGTIVYYGAKANYISWSDENECVIPKGEKTIALLNASEISKLKDNDGIDVSLIFTLNNAFGVPIIGQLGYHARIELRVNGETRNGTSLNATGFIWSRTVSKKIRCLIRPEDMPINSVQLYITNLGKTLILNNISVTGILDRSTSKENAVAASAIRWSVTDGVWRPRSTYNWNVPLDNTGRTASGDEFNSFNYTDGVQNKNWNKNNTIDKYDQNGLLLQTTSPNGHITSTLLNNQNATQIASIDNAKYGEFLFTDFTNNNLADFNGNVVWATSEGYHKFSSRAVKITGTQGTTDQYARSNLTPVNNIIGALGGKAYTIEFWAKSEQISSKSFVHLQTDTDVLSTNVVINLTNNWQKYSVMVNFNSNVNDKRYRVVLRPPVSSPWNFENGAIYYDDIRVFPKAAQMITNYYDQKWNLPLFSIDQNNNPSNLIEYDDYRRIKGIYKQKDNQLIQLQKKEYHLMGELLPNEYFRINNPVAGVTYHKGLIGAQLPSVKWETNSSINISNVKITILSDQHSWDLQSNTSNDGIFVWIDPTINPPYTNCKIKVSDVNDPTHFAESSGYFTIVP